jgi:hypothetical protein
MRQLCERPRPAKDTHFVPLGGLNRPRCGLLDRDGILAPVFPIQSAAEGCTGPQSGLWPTASAQPCLKQRVRPVCVSLFRALGEP